MGCGWSAITAQSGSWICTCKWPLNAHTDGALLGRCRVLVGLRLEKNSSGVHCQTQWPGPGFFRCDKQSQKITQMTPAAVCSPKNKLRPSVLYKKLVFHHWGLLRESGSGSRGFLVFQRKMPIILLSGLAAAVSPILLARTCALHNHGTAESL